jgi:hypothetical protein
VSVVVVSAATAEKETAANIAAIIVVRNLFMSLVL